MTEAMFPIYTSRLLLRPLQGTDANAIYELYSDWEVSRQLSQITFPFTFEAAQQFIQTAQQSVSAKSSYMLGIVQRSDENTVGVISLRVPSLDPSYPQEWRLEDEGLGIVGYSIVRSAWGQGYATESVQTVISFAAGILGLTRLQATSLRQNTASRRVLERLGFQIAESDILEEPLYGGPARIADCYILRLGEQSS
jgi:RimJ/RimL family protein N-acetyltransferase